MARANPRPAAPARAPLSLWLAYAALVALLGRFWVFGAGRGTAAVDGYGLRTAVFAAVAGGLIVLHGRRRMGGARLLSTLGFIYAFSLAVELVGVTRGWPFGSYSYGPAFPLKILGLVPALVPWLWAALAYLAFATTEAILGAPAAEWRPWVVAARRAVPTAFLLLAYDLVADPNHVLRGGWSFQGGGRYFGVPAENFVGWLAVGWVLGFALHRLAATTARGPSADDVVLAAAYATVLAHESLFAARIAGHFLPAAIGALEAAAVIALVTPLRVLARNAWTSLRPGEAVRGTVFALAGFVLGQPSPLAPGFDFAALGLCLIGGFAGAGAVLGYNSYEGLRRDRHNRRHHTHPLVMGQLSPGQQLAVAVAAGAICIACFAAYRPLAALAAAGALGAGAVYSAERWRGKERSGVPSLLHLAGAALYFWAGAAAAITTPLAATTAVALGLLFVAGHLHHVVIDCEADRAAGLETLAVRHGVRFASACSGALFAVFYLLVAVSWVRGWWPVEMAGPFLAGAIVHAFALAILRPWTAGAAAGRYCAFYRVLFFLCAALALAGWWSREPLRPRVTARTMVDSAPTRTLSAASGASRRARAAAAEGASVGRSGGVHFAK